MTTVDSNPAAPAAPAPVAPITPPAQGAPPPAAAPVAPLLVNPSTGDLPPANGPTPTAPAPYAVGDWRASLPAELQQDSSLKTMNTIEALAKSYVHTKKLVGADKIAIPGKHATADDWKNFYQAAGLPETVENYQVKMPNEAKYVDQNLVNSLKPEALKLGILPHQLEGLLQWYEADLHNAVTTQNGQKQTQLGQEIAALKGEWGMKFESRVAKANRVLAEYGGPDIFEYMKSSGLETDVRLTKVLGMLGDKLYTEDVPPNDRVRAAGGIYDPHTALEKATEIIRDMAHPYHDAQHPKHEAAQKEVAALYAMAHAQA